MENTTVRTERLELRPVQDEDVDRILEYRNLPQVTRWLLRTQVDPASFRAAWRRAAADPDDHSMAATLDGRGDRHRLARRGRRHGSTRHAGHGPRPGSATSSIRPTTEPATRPRRSPRWWAYAFDRLGIRRITAGCFADNLASVRILEKVGMRREQHGVGDSWHAERGWVDGYTYALLAEAWRGGRRHRRSPAPGGGDSPGHGATTGPSAHPGTGPCAPPLRRRSMEAEGAPEAATAEVKHVDRTRRHDRRPGRRRAQGARRLRRLTQERIDQIVAKASVAALGRHGDLARLAVAETGRGVFEDKAVKNIFACEHVTNHMASRRRSASSAR